MAPELAQAAQDFAVANSEDLQRKFDYHTLIVEHDLDSDSVALDVRVFLGVGSRPVAQVIPAYKGGFKVIPVN